MVDEHEALSSSGPVGLPRGVASASSLAFTLRLFQTPVSCTCQNRQALLGWSTEDTGLAWHLGPSRIYTLGIRYMKRNLHVQGMDAWLVDVHFSKQVPYRKKP
jgi:hypothetical protein